MAQNQSEFLGYANTNGVSTSMRDVQALQMKFWMDVYAAAVGNGCNSQEAVIKADKANERFKERFVPPR